MPCGGIWMPVKGTHWLNGPCWCCGKTECELFCDEWDTPLHIECLSLFLRTDEGRLTLLDHKHGIYIPENHEWDEPIDVMHPKDLGAVYCGLGEWLILAESVPTDDQAQHLHQVSLQGHADSSFPALQEPDPDILERPSPLSDHENQQ